MDETVVYHLTEFKRRLLVSICFFVTFFVICMVYSPEIFDVVTEYGKTVSGMNFTYIYPQEIFMQQISLAFWGANICALPVTLYELSAFVFPALTRKEKAIALVCLSFSVLLFFAGAAFCLSVLLPFCLQYFMSVNIATGITGAVSVEKYIGFAKMLTLSIGILFEIPVVSAMLTCMGVLNAESMAKARKVVILVSFLLAAFITPPDVVSQVIVAIPMIFLFEAGIVVSRIVVKHKARKGVKNEF